jgi:hypothetical protein
MGDIVITITGSDPNNGELTLSDGGITSARPGDQITWVIEPDSGVASITSIVEKSTIADVFIPDPAKLPGGSTNWYGTVNSNLPVGTEEFYTINWTDAKSGVPENGADAPKSFYAKIQINP